ncbi:jacalin-related lectin 3 [Ricinus communis]|uniref:jacalin-related lectin 3 n=1 Tax=Ricinus communis TaxID=3988 RepID=UPI000772D2CA|nr:jacalin-related lectin 3 [Ricinus communis]|eukprot:XP_002510454.2 jacalin-related lectin 3 [Ricinus communis]
MSYGGYENNYISVGPWGGQNGVRWDDGISNSVRQVIICHGAAVDSIQFEYDKKGTSVWSEKHGGTGCIKINKVKFDYPDEYLVSVSGHYGSVVEYYGPVLVRSLMFQTNRRKYGPFGIQQGTQFSFPLTGGQVVGFHGRSSWYLDSIGVYLKPFLQRITSNDLPVQQNYATTRNNDKRRDYSDSDVEKNYQVAVAKPVNKRQAVSYGPWGGNGGMIFDDGVYTGVREIHITRYGGVLSLRVCYDLSGQAIWGNKNGGSGGIRLDKIAFDYPSEILTHVTGYYGSTILRGPTVVKSLTFHTNKRKYGPFGDEQGISFSSGPNNGIVVGFHGRKGWFIDSIGVHVAEKPIPLNTSNDLKVHEGKIPLMVKELVSSWASGPWGGNGGKPWDDGVFSGIKKIFLAKGEAIYCIQIEYDRNGQSAWSVRHGGGSEGSSHLIKLEYPHETLTSICGYYGSFTGEDSNSVIKSLTFYTNKGKYGPFGEEVGTFFTSSNTEGKIVGFHGRSGCYLNAIGVHMQQWSGDPSYVGSVKTILNKLFN